MRELLKRLAPRFLIKWYQSLRYLMVAVQFYVYRIFPIVKIRVVLTNVWGFGDNIKYVTEELIKRNTSLELIFVCNHPKPEDVPSGVKLVKANTPKANFYLATARVWVECNRKEAYIKKRKGQYYIQLWHGGLALKKIEGDCAEFLGDKYIKRAKADTKMTDLYVSNGAFCSAMYRRAFWYTGKILECGSPRMDYLLAKEGNDIDQTDVVKAASYETAAISIKKKLGIPENHKIAIYAPTYRSEGDLSVYEIDYKKLRTSLMEQTKKEWSVLVRLHPLAAKQSSGLSFGEHVYDMSSYKDLYELMKASDLLITDYSNIMFEFAIMGRPVILYAKDLEEYKSDRGFYFEYEKLPFPIAKTMEELSDTIACFDAAAEAIRVQAFLATAGVCETGHACKSVCDEIIKVIR